MNIYSPYSASQPPFSPYRSQFAPLSQGGGVSAAPLGGDSFFCPLDRSSSPSATVVSSQGAERTPSAPATTGGLPAFAGSQGEGYPWLKLLAGVGTFGASAFLLHRFWANPVKTALSHAVSDAVEKPAVQKLAEQKPALNTTPKKPQIVKPTVSQPVKNHAESVVPDKPSQPVEPIPSDKSGKSGKTSGADQRFHGQRTDASPVLPENRTVTSEKTVEGEKTVPTMPPTSSARGSRIVQAVQATGSAVKTGFHVGKSAVSAGMSIAGPVALQMAFFRYYPRVAEAMFYGQIARQLWQEFCRRL